MKLNDNQIFLYKEFPERKKFLSEYAIACDKLALKNDVVLDRIKGRKIDDLVENFIKEVKPSSVEILYNPKYSGDFVCDGTGCKPFLYNERGVSRKVAEKVAKSFSKRNINASVRMHSVSLRYFLNRD